MPQPQLLFLGFRLAHCDPPPVGWGHSPQTDQITAICNVSGCAAGRDWSWDLALNRAKCLNTIEEALAEGVDPVDEDRSHYKLCAYRAVPMIFGPTGAQVPDATKMFEPLLPPLPLESDLSDFIRLGYDVVEYMVRPGQPSLPFGCSPLFCNGMAHLFWVNQYCLLPDLATAQQVAALFGKDQPEPGPYVIVEVLEKVNK